ncbi:GAF and ANTAR domain-containing protein [Blastococcus sp. URHD0036]|uniref:GAF and ANTAR domain-containing protein n=1 Tax=Blastococcus sp. URHD0036 TaxID=1380356 RepID=UPI000ABDAC88|nr:GAF and ANTAR domain-containing protein [Blastococcus sp. URHD0036]
MPNRAQDDADSAAAPVPLATALGDLARQLEQEDDPDAVLDDIVRAATAMIPGASEASISTTSGGKVDSRAASGELPRLVDALQQETRQGPCLDALGEHRTVHVPDMATERRWPHFATRAAALGAGSMLCFQLYVEDDNIGALNLYAGRAHAFDEASEHIGLLFAAHAAIAYAGARKREDLERALDARDLIGQAKGILMERYGLTGQRAFQLLVRLSNESNRRLRDLALDVVRSSSAAEPAGPVTAGRSRDVVVPRRR